MDWIKSSNTVECKGHIPQVSKGLLAGMNWRPVLFIFMGPFRQSDLIIDELTILTLTLEFLRTQKFGTFGS
jgi:hypothetical protein